MRHTLPRPAASRATRPRQRTPASAPSADPAGVAAARLSAFADPGSFVPDRPEAFDGVVSGSGRFAGRHAVVWTQEPTFRGGSLGGVGGELIARSIKLADGARMPVVGLVASGGARIHEGAAALTAYADIFHAQALAEVPQISVIWGICAGGGAYSPALGDFVIMVERDAQAFLTGPRVVRQVTREDVTAEALGGTRVQGRNGVAHLTVPDLATAAQLVRRILRHLPASIGQPLPRCLPEPPPAEDPASVLPASARQVYDVRDLANRLVDGGRLLELAPGWARNLVVGFAHLDGWPVGVIANQPRYLGGVLDAEAADKGEWFVRLCDRFGLPLAVLVDTPGFLPGVRQEGAGVIRRGAGLVRAFAQARVPRATVTVRAAFGGAHIAMNSRGLGATVTAAWPNARIGVMGAPQAVEVTQRRAIAAGEDVERLVAAYEDTHLPAERALAVGAIDELVAPERTRELLIAALTPTGPTHRGDSCR